MNLFGVIFQKKEDINDILFIYDENNHYNITAHTKQNKQKLYHIIRNGNIFLQLSQASNMGIELKIKDKNISDQKFYINKKPNENFIRSSK